MKILFFMRSTIYVRNLESTLRMLAERGHEVHVAAEPYLPESNELIARLCREHPQLHYSEPPAVSFTTWSFFGLEMRRALDYLRYLGPEYAAAPKLRVRAERNAPPFVLALLKRRRFAASAFGRALLARVLHWFDRAVPRHPDADAFIETLKPDLVLVTPLVEPGSPQAEYLRSARAAGARTGLCVYSWDNLTNKGLIHDPLDVVTVWNDSMKREAVTLHHVPADRVVVTGAAAYDHWFGWRPRATREAFCARVGLPVTQPYLLYLCSSRFIAPNEVEFVRRWVGQLRAASATLRNANVLVRPHPQNTDQWKAADVSDLGGVVVWPPAGANPLDADSRADYYDSIYHSGAVVGVNTSAQVESAIVGRGVYTVLDPEFRDTQDGTLHFQHLRDVNGGLLHVADTFDEHVAQLEDALVRGSADDRCRRFVENFIRPFGIDVPATPRLVEALEATAALGRPKPDRGPWWAALLRPALWPLAVRLDRAEQARLAKVAAHDQVKAQLHVDRLARRAEAQAAKRQAEAERIRQKELANERREAERRAREAFEMRAFEHYRQVRAWAADMRTLHGSEGAAADGQASAALAPLRDATLNTIARLRHFAEPISGVRSADYASPGSELAPRLKREVGFLRKQVGGELFVHEPPALGGFGFTDQGALYNEDTVKFFNVLVALQDAAVLPGFRATSRRRLVWEIGGGWGGFAYQFKHLCPNVTYLITAPPDQFLLSAVYLMSLFPEACCRFYTPGAAADLWRDWERVDFVFVPDAALPSLAPPRVDLTLDLMALRAMGCTRAGEHVRRAYDFGSAFFYTLQPGAAAADASCVPAAIARLYWPHPVPVRRDPKTLDGPVPPPPPALSHLVGWRRMHV